MAKKGLLVEYEWCTGCHTCEVSCMQENDLPVGQFGIKVNEYVTRAPSGRTVIDYVPVVTELCNLCAARTARGKKPACVKNCQSQCMYFGEIGDLAEAAESMKKTVLLFPR